MQPGSYEIVICADGPRPDTRSVSLAKCFVTLLLSSELTRACCICLIPPPGTKSPPKLSHCHLTTRQIFKSNTFPLKPAAPKKERAFRTRDRLLLTFKIAYGSKLEAVLVLCQMEHI